MSAQALSFTQKVNAPPEQVYRAFTNGTSLREWLCDIASAVPNPGGRLYLWWNNGYYSSGEYLSAESPKGVSFTWHGHGEPAGTRVRVTLAPQDGGTLVTLEHLGVTSAPQWVGAIEEIKKGWKNGLENLASVLETGEDLRFTRRPMLGIGIADFDEKIAQNMGIPISKGIRIDNPIEGMGAAAAGLKSNDVIVKMGGHEVTDWTSLTNALAARRAGDEIELVFYRGAQQQTVNMKLSGRPIPEIPQTAADLADKVRVKYAGQQGRLAKVFEGVSETQAAHKPAPGEWSAKEVMAHLIHSERGTRQWISDLVSCQEPIYDDFGGNLETFTSATIATYPRVADLLAEYQRNCTENVAVLDNLQQDFLANKGSYWRLAYQLIEEDFHFDSHLEQIKSAIASES